MSHGLITEKVAFAVD